MRKISSVIIIATLIITLFAPSAAFAKDDLTGTYFESAMRQMIERGWLGGYEDGTYRPNGSVTRAEFTSMLVRALDLKQQEGAESFKDVKKGKWYYNSIQIASSHNLIGGYAGGVFKPNNKITREEMAAITMRALNRQGVRASEQALDFVDADQINPMFRTVVRQALFLGIFGGKVKNGKPYFAPKDYTTRGETAAIILRMINRLDNPKMIVSHTNYSTDFNKAMDIQMTRTPKLDGSGNYIASRGVVTYYANPSNFSSNASPYNLQYLVLSHSAGVNAKELNEKILTKKAAGILANQGEAFVKAGKEHGVNEIYLIAHALHETGNGTSDLAKGVPVDDKGNVVSKDKAKHTVYNFFGYGAVDSDPLRAGAKYAFDKKWFSIEAAIIGGAKEINTRYLRNNYKQDTLYKMRWNPENPGYPQYATHVQWAISQTKRMSNYYDRLSTHGVWKFDIPRYKNQPGKTALPTGADQYHVDKKLAGEKGKVIVDNLKLRKGPTTSFDVITSLSKGTTFEVIGENYIWYKIKVNGKTGWVAKQEPGNAKVKHVQLDKDAKTTSFGELFLFDEGVEEEKVKDLEVATVVKEAKVDKENANVVDSSVVLGVIIGEDEVTVVKDPTDVADAEDAAVDEANVVATVDFGSTVEIVDHVDNWYQIVIDDTQGWVHEDSILLVEEDTVNAQ